MEAMRYHDKQIYQNEAENNRRYLRFYYHTNLVMVTRSFLLVNVSRKYLSYKS